MITVRRKIIYLAADVPKYLGNVGDLIDFECSLR